MEANTPLKGQIPHSSLYTVDIASSHSKSAWKSKLLTDIKKINRGSTTTGEHTQHFPRTLLGHVYRRSEKSGPHSMHTALGHPAKTKVDRKTIEYIETSIEI